MRSFGWCNATFSLYLARTLEAMSAHVFIWLPLSLDWAEIVRIILSSANGICRARASTGCTKLQWLYKLYHYQVKATSKSAIKQKIALNWFLTLLTLQTKDHPPLCFNHSCQAAPLSTLRPESVSRISGKLACYWGMTSHLLWDVLHRWGAYKIL